MNGRFGDHDSTEMGLGFSPSHPFTMYKGVDVYGFCCGGIFYFCKNNETKEWFQAKNIRHFQHQMVRMGFERPVDMWARKEILK